MTTVLASDWSGAPKSIPHVEMVPQGGMFNLTQDLTQDRTNNVRSCNKGISLLTYTFKVD